MYCMPILGGVWTLGSYPEKCLKNSYPRIESGRFGSYQTIVFIIGENLAAPMTLCCHSDML